jgi:hypothetical protein
MGRFKSKPYFSGTYRDLGIQKRLGLHPTKPQVSLAPRANQKIDTFRAMFKFHIGKMKHKSISIKVSRTYPNPIVLAREWQKALRNGDCTSPAELARNLGISRARVTQVLRLLSLAPEIIDTIATLGDPLPSPIVTERGLRPIVNLPADEQRRRLRSILANITGKP